MKLIFTLMAAKQSQLPATCNHGNSNESSTSNGVIVLFLFEIEERAAITVNADLYRDMLNESDEVWFHEDGSTCRYIDFFTLCSKILKLVETDNSIGRLLAVI